MGILKTNKQPYKPLDRVIVFASDQSEKYYSNIYNVDRIESGHIIASSEDEEIVIPISDAKPFVSSEGMIYAVNCNLDYLSEIQHLGEVERNIIVQQAFAYPGTSFEPSKSNMLLYVIAGILGLVAIVAMMV